MSTDLYNSIDAKDDADSPFVGEFGIVAEVDHRTLRVKVIIPAIDENLVHDDWVTPLVAWTGKPGYGPVNAPQLGSEVALFGRFGDTLTLFYLSRYNEDFQVPSEFPEGVRGLRTEGDYKIISDLDLVLIGGRIHLESSSSVRIVAPGGFFVNGRRIG